MDRISEMMDRLGDLSPEELDELESSVLSEFDSVEKQDPTREVVDQMNRLADSADAVRAERANRETEAAELSTAHEAAVARVRGEETAAVDGEVPEDPDAEPDADLPGKKKKFPPEPEPDAEEPEPVFAVEVPEPEVIEIVAAAVVEEAPPVEEVAVAAVEEVSVEAPVETVAATEEVVEAPVVPEAELSDASEQEAEVTPEVPGQLSTNELEAPVTAAAANEPGTIEVPADRRPTVKTAPVAITAGADIPGVTAGSPLPDMKAVATAIVKRLHAMGRTSGGDGEQHTIATITASFSKERTLYANDFEGNTEKIQNVVSPQAITAAGGSMAPVDTRYDIFGLGELGRPVRDSLAVFTADRGGIRYVVPPTLAALQATGNGADGLPQASVSLWTMADDISALDGNPVKPCLRIACGAEVVVYTEAIPLCLTFGNLATRAYPELVERHTQLAMIWHDRYAETRLLTRLGSLSTSVSAAQKLGAVRDFFVTLDKAAAGYRNRHRMTADAPLRVLLPEWFKNMLRADLTQQLPGDGGTAGDDTIGIATAALNKWFAVRGVNVTWFLDGEEGQILPMQTGAGAYTLNNDPAVQGTAPRAITAAGATALNGFPSTVIWYLFAEGTFLLLDGGTLDLGLVRDSTLNGTNDYKIFLETFEGLAKIGIESLRITSTLTANGATAGTVTP